MVKQDDNEKKIEEEIDDLKHDVSDDVAPHADEGKGELEIELEKVKSDYQDLENRLKRALADYQNLEKRVSEGRAELASWATSSLVQKLLPVMDHFDKALAGVTDEEKKSGWFKGVEMSV